MERRPAGCGDSGAAGRSEAGSCPLPRPRSTGRGLPGASGSPAGRENGVNQRPALRHFGEPCSDLAPQGLQPPAAAQGPPGGGEAGAGLQHLGAGGTCGASSGPAPRLRSLQKQVGAWGLAGAELPGSDSQIRVCRREPRLPRRGAKSAHSGQRAGNNWGLSGWRPGAGGPSRAGGVGWGSSEQGLQQRQEWGALLLPPLLPPATHTHPH